MDKLYVYCTDFIINLANLLGLSYYEINTFLFCFIYPVITLLFLIIYVLQKRKLNRLKLNSLNSK